MSDIEETTLNLPSIAVLLVVSVLAVRWFFASPSPDGGSAPPSASARATAASRGAGVRVNPAHVDTVAAMFPQLERRAIMWDLQRNGGNVQATTERALGRGGLETVSALLDLCAPRGWLERFVLMGYSL